MRWNEEVGRSIKERRPRKKSKRTVPRGDNGGNSVGSLVEGFGLPMPYKI